MKRVTEELFNTIKKPLYNRFTRPAVLAHKHELSLKTIYQIRGSKDFHQYMQQNHAQHPDTKYSLRDEVMRLHRYIFTKPNDKYIPPLTAKIALYELNSKAIQDRKSE